MPGFKVSEVPPSVCKLFLLAQGKIEREQIASRELEQAAQWVVAQSAAYKDEPSAFNFTRLFDIQTRARIGIRTYHNAMKKRIFSLSRFFGELKYKLNKKDNFPGDSDYFRSVFVRSRYLTKVEGLANEDFCFLLSAQSNGRKSFEELVKIGDELFSKISISVRPFEEVYPTNLVDQVNKMAIEFLREQNLVQEKIVGFINLVNKATARIRDELGITDEITVEQIQAKSNEIT